MLEAAGCNSVEIAFLKDSVFSDWRTLRELRELLADLFAAHLCFPNDQVRHTRAAYETVAAFYEFDFERVFLNSVLSEFRLRHLAITALLSGGEAPLQTYHQQAEDFIQNDVAGNASHPLAASKFDNLKQCAGRIGNALRALLLLRCTREISALLEGLAACAGSAGFLGESAAESLLVEFRHFLSNGKAPSPAENYAFLDRLWFMVLRKQQGILT